MPRFFIPPSSAHTGELISLSGDSAAHITRSLRMRPGERLTLSDGEGTDFETEIVSVGETVETKLIKSFPSAGEPGARITLFMALPKGDKMDFIVQKAVELGVSVIFPVLTSRCVSRPDKKSMEKKLARFRKIALEAAQQSGRGRIPEVRGLISLEESISFLPEKSVLFYEKGGARLCTLIGKDDKDIGVFVGSEGGFSPEEADFLSENGVSPATLGTRILRCETAPLCGISVILSLTGDI